MKDDYYLSIPDRYPKPLLNESELAESQAELNRERREKESQERARWEAEYAERARRLHEVRARAGRKGAERRWAQHNTTKKRTRPERDDWHVLDRIKVAAGLLYFGWRLVSRMRSRKND